MDGRVTLTDSQSASPLTAEERTFLGVPGAAGGGDCTGPWRLSALVAGTHVRRAIVMKLLDPGLSDKAVARQCGLSDRQLRRYPEYRARANAAAEQWPCAGNEGRGWRHGGVGGRGR